MIIWMTFIGCLNEKECPEVKQIDYKLMPNAYWTNEAKNDIAELWEFHKKQQTPYHGYVDVALIFRTIKQRGEKALSITLEKKEEGPFKWPVLRTSFYVT